MHKTRNDLPLQSRDKVVRLLNARLAEAIDVRLQIYQAHWNVKGPNFIALHELFDAIGGRVVGHIDNIAERAVALGGTANGTVQAVAKSSKLDAYSADLTDGKAHVEALSDTLAAYGKAIRKAIDEADDLDDADTADLFTGISREVDKDLWFLEAHLQAAK